MWRRRLSIDEGGQGGGRVAAKPDVPQQVNSMTGVMGLWAGRRRQGSGGKGGTEQRPNGT